jgi:hypothetical protein
VVGALPTKAKQPIRVGVDASTNHHNNAIVAVTYMDNVCRLVFHRIFTPTPGDPIHFEDIEFCLLDLNRRFLVRKILFDPYQMAAVAQRLVKGGLPIEEFPQTVGNLTAATTQLFELVAGQALVMYPSEPMRLAVSRCVVAESSRGLRLAKEKQSHRIDIIVALSMACHAAVQGQNVSLYDPTMAAWQPDFIDKDVAADEAAREPTAAQQASQNAASYIRAFCAANGLFV